VRVFRQGLVAHLGIPHQREPDVPCQEVGAFGLFGHRPTP
jgi:hypothetical protein